MLDDEDTIHSLTIVTDDCDPTSNIKFYLSRRISIKELTELEEIVGQFLTEKRGAWNNEDLDQLIQDYLRGHELGIFYERDMGRAGKQERRL